jgi:hypothetical protein
MRLARAPALEIRPTADRIRAGETAGGRLVGFEGVVEVALVRRERSPERDQVVTCATATLRTGATRHYVLEVPPGLPPTAAGRRCAIEYEITAKEALGDGRSATATVTLTAAGRTHLRSDAALADRVLANADARRFHLELAAADLQGGGRISGRVHRHERWAPGAPTVEVSLVEAWRAGVPSMSGIANWDSTVLWSARTTVDVDPDRTWMPFEFQIPPGLPPAVEGRAIAWRYELTARRSGLFTNIGGHAMLTPLLFEGG